MPDQDVRKQLIVQVSGTPPDQTAPALFGNFLAVARVGNQVQLEFIYLDVNVLAQMVQKTQELAASEPPQVSGQTVVKVVMPAEAFLAVRNHMEKVFSDITRELTKNELGEHDARKRATH